MKNPAKILFVLTACLILSCSGSKPEEEGPRTTPDKEKLIGVLTLFVEAVQGDRFDKAFAYLTPSELSKMADATGQPSALVKRQLKALRLSTLAQKAGVRLDKGKLEGLYEWLPQVEAPPPSPVVDPEAPLIQ